MGLQQKPIFGPLADRKIMLIDLCNRVLLKIDKTKESHKSNRFEDSKFISDNCTVLVCKENFSWTN